MWRRDTKGGLSPYDSGTVSTRGKREQYRSRVRAYACVRVVAPASQKGSLLCTRAQTNKGTHIFSRVYVRPTVLFFGVS